MERKEDTSFSSFESTNGERQVRNKDGVNNLPVRSSTYQTVSKKNEKKNHGIALNFKLFPS